MDKGDDFGGKVINHPKSKGIGNSVEGKPQKFDRGRIDRDIDNAVSKRKTLSVAFVEFIRAVPIWLWLIVASVLFGLAKTLEYLSARFFVHMNAQAFDNPSQNALEMMFAWNRLGHFLNIYWYGSMGLAALILFYLLLKLINTVFQKG